MWPENKLQDESSSNAAHPDWGTPADSATLRESIDASLSKLAGKLDSLLESYSAKPGDSNLTGTTADRRAQELPYPLPSP